MQELKNKIETILKEKITFHSPERRKEVSDLILQLIEENYIPKEDKEKSEQEFLDSYHKEVGEMYPKNKPIIL